MGSGGVTSPSSPLWGEGGPELVEGPDEGQRQPPRFVILRLDPEDPCLSSRELAITANLRDGRQGRESGACPVGRIPKPGEDRSYTGQLLKDLLERRPRAIHCNSRGNNTTTNLYWTPLMPILDAGAYSQPNTEYVLDLLVELSGDDQFHAKYDTFFFNLYLGDKYVSFPKGMQHFHVCKHTEYGYLFAIFHTVLRRDVIGNNVMFPDYKDTCVTLLWTAKSDNNDHVTAALNYADEVIRNVEFATGKAIPIGLGEIQRQSNFEVAHINVNNGTVDRISLQNERNHVPALTPRIAPILNALMGFDDEYEKIKDTEPVRLVNHAGRWQQKAIRAHGSGEYADCVVCSAIWAETFLVRITGELMALSGNPIAELKAEMQRGIPQFLNRYLGSKFLKGNWDHTSKDTDVGKWYQTAYNLRSRVVHEGYIPTSDEAYECYERTHEFVRTVSNQIGKLKDPKLAMTTRFFNKMPS